MRSAVALIGVSLSMFLFGCAPNVNNENKQAILTPQINRFEVLLTENTPESATVTVNIDVSALNDGNYESIMFIKSSSLNMPMIFSLGKEFPYRKQFVLTGWKNNTLSGSLRELDGTIIRPAAKPLDVPSLFTPPETAYEFTIFIRDTATKKQIFQKQSTTLIIK